MRRKSAQLENLNFMIDLRIREKGGEGTLPSPFHA
jgi:hypothetical protein